MRAALIEEIGRPLAAGEAPEPERDAGEALVEITAAPINPIDLSIGEGRFYGGVPDVPYVPGVEGFGRMLEAEGLERAPVCTSRRAAVVADRAASPSVWPSRSPRS